MSQTAFCQKVRNGTRFALVLFDSVIDSVITIAGFQKTLCNFSKQGNSRIVLIIKILTILRKFL